ncbi:histone H1oo-like [Heterocephalus glaber]|uniref:Histone H1.8 n=1 Tax=Heterocephalus glaber TaxID=10181 RepID=A0AAX6QE48_HETGA|nr:histone H1oo-like [Heterocephalus glaber]
MLVCHHPTVLRMVLEALQAGEQRHGTSVAAIKLCILHKYPTVDVIRFKYLLKQALATSVCHGLLTRPLNSKARGATGSFKLVPKLKRKTWPSRKPLQRGLASSSKKGPVEPGEPRVPPRLAKALEKAPQGGCKGTRPQQGEARKGPPKPVGASSRVHRLDRKSKVLDTQGRQGEAGAPGKTVAMASKAGKGAASPTGRKPAIKATSGPGPEATTAPKFGGPRRGMLSPARRAGGLCRPRPLVKALSSPSSSSEPRG